MRNIRCPAYSGCLDTAISLNLPDWECAGCRQVLDEGPIDPAELDGAVLMLIAIFFPATYAEIQKKKQVDKNLTIKIKGIYPCQCFGE